MTTTDARTAPDWIDALCDDFIRGTGWSLRFHPVDEGLADETRRRLRSDPDCCWCDEIHDGRRVIGLLSLGRHLPSGEASRQLAQQIGCFAARLLSQLAAAQRRLDSRTREVSTLVEIGRSVPHGTNLQASLQKLLKAATQLTGFWKAAFFLVDPNAATVQLRVTSRDDGAALPRPERPLGPGCPDLEALTRGSLVLDRSRADAGRWLPEDCETAVCVRVCGDAGPIGTLWVYERRRRGSIGERQVHVLQSVAMQLAAVLERTVLLQESRRQQQLKRELAEISSQQASGYLRPPPVDWGLDVAQRCVSADEVGGDLCEVFPTSARRTVVMVGDAVGHSIPATIVMSVARGALRTLLLDQAADLSQTDEIVTRTNSALYSVTRSEQFMSLICGVIDSASMTFSYTNAGHPNPILIRDGVCSSLDSHGLLLGIVADSTYERSVLPLAPGDTLVLYSDGLTEAMNRSHQVFRSEGIVNAVHCRESAGAEELAEAIWQSMLAHTTGKRAGDDRTLLVAKLRG